MKAKMMVVAREMFLGILLLLLAFAWMGAAAEIAEAGKFPPVTIKGTERRGLIDLQ